MNSKHFEDAGYTFARIDSLDEIEIALNRLERLLSEIDDYHDKSLFFQNPEVIGNWMRLAQALEKIETELPAEEAVDYKKRTEPYAAYPLKRRLLRLKYGDYIRAYYEEIKMLLDQYGECLDGACISAEDMKAISVGQFGKELEDMDDMGQFLAELNDNSRQARFSTYKTLSDVYRLFIALMNRCGDIVWQLDPSDDDLAKAIDSDLREWTLFFGKDIFKEAKEDLNRHYKTHRTDKNTPELWSEMFEADEEALKLAKTQELAKCDAEKQEHWGEDMKAQMDANGRLMQQILISCQTDELFNFSKEENVKPFIELLTPDNLEMFYDIIVRRTLIQCEMFPELKALHDEWLNPTKAGQPEAAEGDEPLSDDAAAAAADESREDSDEDNAGLEGRKPGAKAKSFREFVINQNEADRVVDIIKRNLLKNNPKQAALLIIAAIEALKVSPTVTMPSISREFGVNENSIKPHFTKYRSAKNSNSPHFTASEIAPYKKFFDDK